MKKMMVKLRNSGIEELRALVNVLNMSLKKLFKEHPTAFYDVVMIARDSSYEPFGTNGEFLRQLGLLERDNGMHDSTRNIILASVEGDMLKMRLVNPIIEE